MENNKILELILKELLEVKVTQNEMKTEFSEMKSEISEMKSEINEINKKISVIDIKIDKLEINQKEIIKEIEYGFSLTAKTQTKIAEAQKEIKEIKNCLDYHNLGMAK